MANPEHLEILKQGVEVWNRWREENPMVRPNLRNASLVRARLESAELSGTGLSGADLTSARLQEAKLIGADLRRANLNSSNLDKADLSSALFGLTTLANLDLSQTKGLDSVRHAYPSEIGILTLNKSRGAIPGIFLRGCGLVEEFIEYVRGYYSQPIEFYSCFISYSHTDKSFAQRLHDQLQARSIRCWLDEHDLVLGDRILDVVNEAIRLHDRLLLCCSLAALTSSWVEDEIAAAVELERTQERLILIPLDLDGFLFDGYGGRFGPRIRERLTADFTGWEHDNAKFEEQFERVVRALRADETSGKTVQPRL